MLARVFKRRHNCRVCGVLKCVRTNSGLELSLLRVELMQKADTFQKTQYIWEQIVVYALQTRMSECEPNLPKE